MAVRFRRQPGDHVTEEAEVWKEEEFGKVARSYSLMTIVRSQ